ncbi:hypothetical protein MCOR27_011379 [Pyricularia oryzae]|uniref:Dolichol-phosphate mannosyltransferase n=2 Tax=Pyricularia TaxID=48558 RepID=A0ABQ8N470_PYRGI|nr:dolichol-phosphate mannosyltransferase [Pyricularia oryzae 70-15]KAH8837198.1 hypothetical protein MCOR01_010835 [Pyricularia oryzae]KAI6290954.1 hypothetical protein MCOR33_010940 [Pyricularia grisea]EHA54079.1 dolichol-phosphate mannosyltransferase [Pyricularia oryzae 70-15]KAH9438142.1 hypothetical protein MCOR02_001782 [Pyricularia oryzae]KAI6253394.1 hypothetical protein MCOR19_010056 [Pyricularia oryzae]
MSTPFPVLVHPFKSPVPRQCAYESGSTTAKNALICIGGLGDGPHTLRYVRTISQRLEKEASLSYSVFEVRLSSAFDGFGTKRLSDDVAEISALVQYLRGIGREKIVLMGHSTGTQDCMEYTNYGRHNSAPVDGFIMQGTVSDREAFGPLVDKKELDQIISQAATLIRAGEENEMMPRNNPVSEVFGAPLTAYRLNSLLSPGGEDDFFSSDLTDDKIASFWANFRKPALVLPSGEDEHVPKSIDVEALLGRWKKLAPAGVISELSGLIPGASHTVRDPGAQEWMCDRIVQFLRNLETSHEVKL